MKIAQSTLRKVIQEEIKAIKEGRKEELLDGIKQTMIRLGVEEAKAIETSEKLAALSEEDLEVALRAYQTALSKTAGIFEIGKLREAPTSDMAELVDRASSQVDLLLAKFMEYAETYPEGALEMYEEIENLYTKYVKPKPVDTDAEEQRDREQNPAKYDYEKDNYIYRIMDLDPTQDEDALDRMSIVELDGLERQLKARSEAQ